MSVYKLARVALKAEDGHWELGICALNTRPHATQKPCIENMVTHWRFRLQTWSHTSFTGSCKPGHIATLGFKSGHTPTLGCKSDHTPVLACKSDHRPALGCKFGHTLALGCKSGHTSFRLQMWSHIFIHGNFRLHTWPQSTFRLHIWPHTPTLRPYTSIRL